MSIQNDEILQTYLDEAREHLASMENDLLAMEREGAARDEELTHRMFRAAHSIKGGAGFVGLTNIKELSHRMESVLGSIRNRELEPDAEIINILLNTTDLLRELIGGARTSNERDISETLNVLGSIENRATQTVEALPETGFDTGAGTVEVPNGNPAIGVSAEALLRAGEEGKSVYRIVFGPAHEGRVQGGSVQELAEDLKPYGTVLDVRENGNGDEAPGSPGTVSILFACMLDPADIASLAGVDREDVLAIEEEFATRPPGGETPSVPGPQEDVPREPEWTRVQTGPDVWDESPGAHAATEPEALETPLAETASGQREAAVSSTVLAEGTLRVPVRLLDSLMTLAGELVLGRNQLLQALSSRDVRAMKTAGQRMDLITSDLQEAIMLTRMQPIGNIFSRFPRVVRELARNMGKEVVLSVEGSEVEMDKTIIESIGDPLTHLVRNAVDHGIEPPGERRNAGKDPAGRIRLKAYHEAGHVHVEIADDGKGLEPDRITAAAVANGFLTEERARALGEKEKMNLIFLPGFSTSERVSELSGRGVGMDVVKSNLDELGGLIHIDSHPGKGTRIRIKLPLTLAIIPSQIILNGGERYAVPQVNVEELLRIPPHQAAQRVERVGKAEVVRLRRELLPLIRLSEVLREKRNGSSPEEREPAGMPGENPATKAPESSSLNIVVVSTGITRYGLVVDALLDAEEIVVKPLGRHFKQCSGYAGATIMGDGRVALILDAHNLARMAELSTLEEDDPGLDAAPEEETVFLKNRARETLLLFQGAEGEPFAVPLNQVERMERIRKEEIREVAGEKVALSRGRTLPLFSVDRAARVTPLADRAHYLVIVFFLANREVGLLATDPVDTTQVSLERMEETFRQTGIKSSILLGEKPTLLVDMFGLVHALKPEWFPARGAEPPRDGNGMTVLLAEDSDFFRNQVRTTVEDRGYTVIEAEDGRIAWDLLQRHANEISLVVTDIEMPHLDGFGLTRRIKQDPRYAHLPVIALTSLAQEEDMLEGKAAGLDEYQIKLDKEKLMESIDGYLKTAQTV